MEKNNILDINTYFETETLFFNTLASLLSQDLYLYCVTGSLSRNDIILGWSDIDILLVVKKYDDYLFRSINRALDESGNKIKIGVTIFTLEEFNHSYFKDAKTYISIDLIRNGKYKPRICSTEIIFKQYDSVLNKYMEISNFSRFSHELKRELLNLEKYDEKKTYKLAIILFKIILHRKNIDVLSYRDVLIKIRDHIPELASVLCEPEDIIKNTHDKTRMYDDYLKILNWLKNNTNVIF